MKAPVTFGRRRAILGLLFASITINLLDRQVLSLVAPLLRVQLNLTNTQYANVVFCFLLGLTLAQVPAGALLDRRGARWGLPFLMLWWSAANALHAAARGALGLGVLRFLLGAGESGNYSAGVKVIAEWFPPERRALAGGIFNTGSVVGAFLAPPVVVFLASRYGWRTAFLLPSVCGLLWIVPWLVVYRRRAPEGPAAGAAAASPVRPIWTRRQAWGAALMRALGGPVNHFYWYWLPLYLRQERGFTLEQIGILAGLPFLFGGLGNLAGGWFSSFLMSRGVTADGARKTAFAGAAALCLASLAVPLAASGGRALALISVASFGVSVYAATWIGLITDLFPQQAAARATGLAGLCEGITNMTFTLLTGRIVDRYSFLPVFLAAGLLPGLGLACLFLWIRRIERVVV